MTAFICWSLLVAAVASEKDEPLLGYTLQVNGKDILLEPGKEVKIEGTFENPMVKLVPKQERFFSAAGVSFKYPAYFTFEADFSAEGIKIWTISGKDFMLMLHQLADGKLTATAMAEAMKSQYGKSAKTSPTERTINGQKLKGVRIRATIAQTTIIQDVLALPTENGSRLLVVQDLAEKADESAAETKLALDLLNETLAFADQH